jgi:hypothetical protein
MQEDVESIIIDSDFILFHQKLSELYHCHGAEDSYKRMLESLMCFLHQLNISWAHPTKVILENTLLLQVGNDGIASNHGATFRERNRCPTGIIYIVDEKPSTEDARF